MITIVLGKIEELARVKLMLLALLMVLEVPLPELLVPLLAELLVSPRLVCVSPNVVSVLRIRRLAVDLLRNIVRVPRNVLVNIP